MDLYRVPARGGVMGGYFLLFPHLFIDFSFRDNKKNILLPVAVVFKSRQDLHSSYASEMFRWDPDLQ